jgi:transcriptional regulator of heat shock response
LNLTADLQEMVPDEAMERFVQLGRAVQDEDAFVAAMRRARSGQSGIRVNIGDLPLPGFNEFSVVSCSFGPYDGILGIIAPVWVDYGRAMSTTTYIASRLETLLVTSTARDLERKRS